MKPGCFYLILPFIIAVIFFFTGCPMKVGECTYGKTPDQRGIVTVKSIEKINSDNKILYRVKVDGFFKRDFIYSAEDFQKKFVSKGYKAGSKLVGIITPGGPCPPMYYISD
jgi:radical SAM superfamily enzyme with C-terminal helix-hairpin-helix motif